VTNVDEVDVFISYARENRGFVEQLARTLRAADYSVWFDQQLHPGDDFHRIIKGKLEAARAVIVVWSTYSVDSKWVIGEVLEAAEQGRLFPIRIEPCRIGPPFNALHTLDLSDQSIPTERKAGVAVQELRRKPMVADAADGKTLVGRHLDALSSLRTTLNTLNGPSIELHFPDFASIRKLGFPKRGGEGYVFPVRVRLGSFTRLFAMKTFSSSSTTRVDRSVFLTQLRSFLEGDPRFQALPIWAVDTLEVGGVLLNGHIAPLVGGIGDSGWRELRELFGSGEWFELSTKIRRVLLKDLALAVRKMEDCGLIHGDLSLANILVDVSAEPKELALCDYDAFVFNGVEPIERPNRPLGTLGFQSPNLFEQYLADREGKADISVDTDRFALAALIATSEMWSKDDAIEAGKRGQNSIVSEAVLHSRSLASIKKEQALRFPSGVALLAKALSAKRSEDMPAPIDWVHALDEGVFIEGTGRKAWRWWGK